MFYVHLKHMIENQLIKCRKIFFYCFCVIYKYFLIIFLLIILSVF